MALLGERAPKTISWEQGGVSQIVYKYPDTELRLGDAVVVRENQLAVFFRDGKVYDTLKPGRTLIATENMPLLTSLLQKIGWDNKSPFQAEIVFLNMAQFKGKFGGKAYSAPSGQIQYQAEVKFFGYYLFKVGDPVLFTVEFYGNRGLINSEDVEDYVRGFVNEKVIDNFGGFNTTEVVKNVDATTDKIGVQIGDEAGRLGLKIIDLVFEGVDIPEEARRFASSMGSTAMMMDYMKGTASELKGGEGGGAAAAGLGGGMGLMMPFMMMQQMQQQKTFPISMESKSCPQCGKGVPADVKFCPYCGVSLEKQPQQKIDIPMINCRSCGKNIPRDVNFCPYCGKEVPQGVVLKCKNCGKGIPPDVKYCPHCGSKIT